MPGKNPVVSKTLFFNILALIILIVDPFGFKDFVGDPKLPEYATAAVTIINIVLRVVTKQPLDFGKLFSLKR